MKTLKISIIQAILLLCGSILAFFFISEVTIRIYHLAKYGRPLFDEKGGAYSVVIDNKLGWKAKENYHFKKTGRIRDGLSYKVEGKTDKWGFRSFGNLRQPPNKCKVMIVGDSFTHALEVSDNQTYYSFLAKDLPIEIFAYGAVAYGNIQEFMIIDEYIDLLKPDILILQLCTNDFINNSYELEYRSIINNQRLKRPYLSESGKIYYATPAYMPEVRNWLVIHSRLFSFVFHRVDLLQAKIVGYKSIEGTIESRHGDLLEYKHSVIITKTILQKIRERAKGIDIYAFVVDRTEPFYTDFRNICETVGIIFIDGIADAVKESYKQGEFVFVQDEGHWSLKGHEVAGEKLQQYFKNHFPRECSGKDAIR